MNEDLIERLSKENARLEQENLRLLTELKNRRYPDYNALRSTDLRINGLSEADATQALIDAYVILYHKHQELLKSGNNDTREDFTLGYQEDIKWLERLRDDFNFLCYVSKKDRASKRAALSGLRVRLSKWLDGQDLYELDRYAAKKRRRNLARLRLAHIRMFSTILKLETYQEQEEDGNIIQ